MAEHGIMIALPMGKGHKEPDGDEPEAEGDDDGDLPEHEYQMEADDVFEALEKKNRTAFAHALEAFVHACKK